MTCRVLKCQNEGEEIFEVQTEPLLIESLVCREHLSAIEEGEEWLWLREPGVGSEWDRSRQPTTLLMGEELKAHNEWVVEELGDFTSGGERSADGTHHVWMITARLRGTRDVETLRLVVPPHVVARRFRPR